MLQFKDELDYIAYRARTALLVLAPKVDTTKTYSVTTHSVCIYILYYVTANRDGGAGKPTTA